MGPEHASKGGVFLRLVETMHRLRNECPWDREQTARSILPYLLEEAHEVVEAVETGDTRELRAELGDLLLQVLFHSEIASERNDFDVFDVIEGVRQKMVRRHPHVFGDVELTRAGDVLDQWARIKAEERGGQERSSVLDGVPKSLAALLRAQRIGEKASRTGFDWEGPQEVLDKIDEELRELREALDQGPERIEEELGDLLLTLTSFARHVGVSAEMALTGATDRFARRFRFAEEELRREGRDIFRVGPEELERLWQAAKEASLTEARGGARRNDSRSAGSSDHEEQ